MYLLFALVFNDLSIWWLIPCLVLGFGYAWLFYQKSVIENAVLKWVLFSLRFAIISLLAILLLSPLIKSVKQHLQKPIIYLAQDASSSIKSNPKRGFDSNAYQKDLLALAAKLSDDYTVKKINFSDQIKADFDFKENGKQTDISSVFEFINLQNLPNVGAVIVVSDGAYNKGTNPIVQISEAQFPIYSVALGDTIPKKDLILMPPTYNQLVYLGNNHQVELTIKAFGAQGANTVVKLTSNDGQIQTKSLNFSTNEEIKTVTFSVEARKKGVQKLTVDISAVADESTLLNNKQTIYIEVLDGREQVLLVADAPHPDISAIKQAIENNKNYDVEITFVDKLPLKTENVGLVILHNLPSKTGNINSFLNTIKDKNKWFIIGAETDLAQLNIHQSVIIASSGGQNQTYSPNLSSDFYAFSLGENAKSNLQNLAPLVAPFANYQVKGAGKVLFNQQIGNVKTKAPLLVFADELSRKSAVLVGEGIWRWRIDNFEKHNNFDVFNELIGKSVQYLSAKDDKRKFRTQSNKSRYFENEEILLNAELYNDAYELVNEPEVTVEVRSLDGKKYSYVFTRTDKAYALNTGILPVGEYNFEAKTALGNKKYQASGSFLVEALNVEAIDSRADHQLLYNLSNSTGGKMVFPNEIMKLADLIKDNEKVKTISRQEKTYDPLINLNWIFVLLMLMLSLEWFLRKRNGAI